MSITLSAADLMLRCSDLYREFTQEREEILKNKWCMSEKEGKDVGFERALMDWVAHHRIEWKKSRKQL